MLFVGKVGSLVRKGWQTQTQFEYEKMIDCSNWWQRFIFGHKISSYKPSKILQLLARKISLMVGRFMNGVLLEIALIPCSQNG
jgi:hypothetical protein